MRFNGQWSSGQPVLTQEQADAMKRFFNIEKDEEKRFNESLDCIVDAIFGDCQ